MGLDFEKIKQAAEGYRADMTAFLRAMISHPSESCEEKEVVACIKAEMEKLNFDKVEVDGLGNVIGWMGEGDKIIAIDSHIDTVGIGNINNWEADPYEGYETDEIIYGRGGSDQEGGMASATYAAKMMKDMGLIPEGYKIMVVGTVQEEDCDGMCWQYIYNKAGIKPEFVISTEPTDGGIYRGHRGRMEIRVDVHGTSCHGSAPDRGDNAIYKMAAIIADVRALNNNGCDESTDIKGLVKMLDPKYNPEHFEDASTIADHLNNKRTVVLNLESTNKEVSRRLVDFLSGVAYANNGQIKRVANSTFIITPYNVDIMGDLLDELENNGAFY